MKTVQLSRWTWALVAGAAVQVLPFGIADAQVPVRASVAVQARPLAKTLIPRNVSVAEALARAQATPLRQVAARARMTPLAGRVVAALAACNPANPVPTLGLMPDTLTMSGERAYAAVSWTPPQAGLNYVIERAPAGTGAWQTVGSTCQDGPSYLNNTSTDSNNFVDGVPTIPNTPYVYKITAIGANGATDWNSFTWNSPGQYYTPVLGGFTHQGGNASINIRYVSVWTDIAANLVLQTSWGYATNLNPADPTQCQTTSPNVWYCHVQLAIPAGNSSVTATLQWGYVSNVLHVTYATTSTFPLSAGP